jgi:hypothetical protein
MANISDTNMGTKAENGFLPETEKNKMMSPTSLLSYELVEQSG